MWVAIAVIVILIAITALYIISIFNRLVSLKNRYENSFSQIEVQLKRRYDLIPNLVETAKDYLAHERETLEAVIKARNTALAGLESASRNPGDPSAMQGLNGAEGALMGALGRLNVVMESYPELKASANMQQLTEELTSTENRVAFARQGYNDAVTEYNTYKQTFPPVFFASTFGHRKNAALLEFVDAKQIRIAPKISFN